MRRILLATTAIVALSAASPAFAFNLTLGGQLGYNTAVSVQHDHANSSEGANVLLAGQAGLGNTIDNGVCVQRNSHPKPNCDWYEKPGQDAKGKGVNAAAIGQLGLGNYAKNRQKAEDKGVNLSGVGQIGIANSAENYQNAKGKGSFNGSLVVQAGLLNEATNDQKARDGKNNTATQWQLGAFNESSVSQDTSGGGGTKGNNDSDTVQVGFGNGSYVSQKGGNDQFTGQLGAGNISVTDQNHNQSSPNDSTTLQAGLGNFSRTTQNGGNSDATTVQGGVGNVSVTSQSDKNNTSQTFQAGAGNTAVVDQSGNGTNWSAVGQVGAGNTFVSVQSSH
ncbi:MULTISPECIES: hypothetical protein [unclassified Devosia]|uniref:hypothetical protein n=1 Tax=unclassified Devosia TaxID=196773 RepID=UPI001AD0CA8F|nr:MULTISPECIES: hypothetical protein [unclassified Devosia]MBN9304983.1 hypothetical protein [Devosia sp.]